MEIIRIPSCYYEQLRYLNESDFNYVLNSFFKKCINEEIMIEKSMRGGLVLSMVRESMQMENKARAKKGEKGLEADDATLSQPMSHHTSLPEVKKSCDQVTSIQVKEMKVNENKLKENNISKDIETSVSQQEIIISDEPLEKTSYGDEDINKIIKAIKDNHGTVDGPIQEQRNFGKLLKNKLVTLEGYDGRSYEFIDFIIKNSDTYRIGKTTSPKKIYYNLAELIANIRQKIKDDNTKTTSVLECNWF